MEHALAIDIGGTKLACGVVDLAGTIVAYERVATPRETDGDALFAAVAALGWRVAEQAGVPLAVCGVGCGGPMTLRGEAVSPVNIPAWRGFPLRARVAAAFGLPAMVDNDAKALALAEGWLGAARGVRNYMGMVVSTGVGGGIVLDGRLLDGATGNAGHVGHIVVEPDGRRCGCGARGCLEAEASGTGIAAATGAPAAEAPPEVRTRAGTLLGRGVAAAVTLLDLEIVCVAGSVALGFGEPFFAAANEELRTRARLPYTEGARIVPAALGPDAPIIGAAAVGFRGAGHPIGVA